MFRFFKACFKSGCIGCEITIYHHNLLTGRQYLEDFIQLVLISYSVGSSTGDRRLLFCIYVLLGMELVRVSYFVSDATSRILRHIVVAVVCLHVHIGLSETYHSNYYVVFKRLARETNHLL